MPPQEENGGGLLQRSRLVTPPADVDPTAAPAARRTLFAGGPSLSPIPAVTNTRPNVGNFLLGLGRGFVEARRGREELQLEQDKQLRAEARETRRIDIAEDTLEAQKEQARAVLRVDARKTAFDILQKNPGLGSTMRALGLENPVGVLTNAFVGDVTPEQEQLLGQGLAEVGKNALLPELAQQMMAVRLQALGPDATEEDRGRIRLEVMGKIGKVLDSQAKQLELGAELTQGQIEQIQANIEQTFAAADLARAQGRQLDVTAIQGDLDAVQNAINTSSLVARSFAALAFGQQGTDVYSQLLNLNPEARANAIDQMPTPQGADPKAKAMLLAEMEKLETLNDAQRELFKKRDIFIAEPTQLDEGDVSFAPEGLPELNPPTAGEARLGRDSAITAAASRASGTMGRLVRGMKTLIKAPFGLSDIDKAADVTQRVGAALQGDERAIRLLATAITPINLSTREPVEDATPEERLRFTRRVLQDYGRTPEQAVEFFIRRGIGDEAFEGMLGDFIALNRGDPLALAGIGGAAGADIARQGLNAFLGPELFQFLSAHMPALPAEQ